MTFGVSTQCSRCGKAVGGETSHDGRGNVYCQACMRRLSGLELHASTAGHACGMCGISYQRAHDGAPAAGKGHYCSDCLGRLRGERPRRRVSVAASFSATIDRAFDQMLEEVFHPGALASAGGQLAMAS